MIEMAKTFYHFLMRYRHPDPTDDISQFANDAYRDSGFPKQSRDYQEISDYLELNGDYLPSLSVFDEAWELYIQIEKPLND